MGVSTGCLFLLATALPAAFFLSQLAMFAFSALPVFKLTRKDQTAAMFCATQKTLAFGMPLIKAFFEGSPHAALITTPLLVIHPLQLLIGSLMIPYLQRYIKQE